MNGVSILFDPAFPWPVLAGAAVCSFLLIAFAAWRGLQGWALRGLAALALLAALSGPSLQQETRGGLPDILVALVDESASQSLSDRSAQTAGALADLRTMTEARDGLDLHVARIGDGADNRGTRLMAALSQVLAELPRDRVAGVVVISDGVVHDLDAAPELPAPAHLLLTGHAADWDRRLVVKTAPAYAIPGEQEMITLRIEDQGAAPGDDLQVPLSITIDGGAPQIHDVPVGADLNLPVTLSHGGRNVIHFSVPASDGELTARNNEAVAEINGVRDRLRVLLVSGQPHPGTRTWRNLLKSDSSVDLVHFTILRPPEKQDGVPVSELSLIAFPTQELFLEKIDEFDLIIFDRYKLRGILPATYLSSVRDYVEAGGAVLVAAGPDFATADSLARSPLADILPAQPDSQVIEAGYLPTVTEAGNRHPVTSVLQDFAPADGWGRWFRLVGLVADKGHVVMEGAGSAPLLTLDRVGEGRVALLGSDHAWLWSRGFEGGGPQLELLRRLAHWMMKEPELEEEALTANAKGLTLTLTRRTMQDSADAVEVTGPDGSSVAMPLANVAPGIFQAEYLAPEMGLYRLKQGDLTRMVALGPATPREYENPIASAAGLSGWLATRGGGVARVEDGVPGLRTTRAGRAAFGRGWIGYTPRAAYVTLDVRVAPLAPAWLMLLLAAGLAVAAWLREGRGRQATQPGQADL